ncbi:hypothetical protein [Dorea longicatena]|uniref:hypothetical protein n=1 Tax=Dorea TaxID=189330 RepID=UPI00118392C4|nr:hypothetical protein [Dorea longicatena]
MHQRNGDFDFQSRRFFVFTKICDSLHGHGGIKGGIAVSILYIKYNILLSKKVIIHKRDIPTIDMNTHIIM